MKTLRGCRHARRAFRQNRLRPGIPEGGTEKLHFEGDSSDKQTNKNLIINFIKRGNMELI